MRIMIFGDSASGKSVFAQKLGQTHDLPVTHIDEVTYELGRENVDKIAAVIRASADGPNWVIDGNAFSKDPGHRLQNADVIYIFECSRVQAVWRVLRRYVRVRFFGEMPIGNKWSNFPTPGFLWFVVARFPKIKRTARDHAEQVGKQVVRVSGWREARQYLSSAGSVNPGKR